MISTFLLLPTKCHADISFTVLNVIGKGQSKMKQNKKQKTRRQQNKTNKQNTKQNTIKKKQTKNKRENSKCLLDYIPGRL